MDIIFIYIVIAFAVSSITFTISVTSIFLEIRELISKIHPKLEQFIHCPWCQSFWLILIILLTSDINLINIYDIYILNLFITIFSIYSVVGLIHYVLLRTYKPINENMMMRNREKQQILRNSKK